MTLRETPEPGAYESIYPTCIFTSFEDPSRKRLNLSGTKSRLQPSHAVGEMQTVTTCTRTRLRANAHSHLPG